MTTRHLTVLMDRRVAGSLTRQPGGSLQFVYDDAYRASKDATPLSVSMPLQIREHQDKKVAPWLWGLLPDNAKVIARWSRQFQVSAKSPFDLLGTPIGHDCAGAVQFTRDEDFGALVNEPGSVVRLTEREVAERLRLLKADSTAWLGVKDPGQFSLAGVFS